MNVAYGKNRSRTLANGTALLIAGVALASTYGSNPTNKTNDAHVTKKACVTKKHGQNTALGRKESYIESLIIEAKKVKFAPNIGIVCGKSITLVAPDYKVNGKTTYFSVDGTKSHPEVSTINHPSHINEIHDWAADPTVTVTNHTAPIETARDGSPTVQLELSNSDLITTVIGSTSR